MIENALTNTSPITTDIEIKEASSNTRFVTFGTTGLRLDCNYDNWRMHFTPRATQDDEPDEEKVSGREIEYVLRFSLGIDLLVQFWEDKSNFLEYSRFDQIRASTNEDMHNHRLTLFRGLEKLSGKIIYENVRTFQMKDEVINQITGRKKIRKRLFYVDHLNVGVLSEVINDLRINISNDDLQKTKYFQRLSQAKNYLPIVTS